MARGITVKVPTAKVIKALKDKLAQNEKDLASNEKNDKAYRVALDKYQKALLKDLAKDLTLDNVNIRYGRTLEVSYKIAEDAQLPKQPERDYVRTLASYEIEEIGNAIRILEMSEEDFVNASTMKQLASYL